MGLSDIAAGLTVTTSQRERGVATVDATAAPLAERLAPYADDLPCRVAVAAALLDAYGAGTSVGAASAAAGVAPTTGAKVLHVLGVGGVNPLSPLAREIVGDWLAGELSRREAVTLSGASDAEFALGAYCATHPPVEGAAAVVAAAREPDSRALDRREREALAGAVGTPDDLR
ncbi:hypothetical protein J2752_001092 [Halarchaeum rubridurum]|uniref:Uncharacterized protein n=1 Tax=Halarchaeum rubridurum TaxID=489911 RepID=A0A830FTC9_9EURY|nr:hypothetical protein [Halarchaeum rubridurum]MBP1954211.1 hypothetical protein [Halarchaeum rubridurum]GGM58199.1 hypothetical protein GCM10009017_05450 [Halarchaeum rubridurum]